MPLCPAAVSERRLGMFALICMQTRFPAACRSLVRKKDRLTPEMLIGLTDGSLMDEQGEPDEEEKLAFCAFAEELCASINTDGREGITDQECRAFDQALAISAITSL